MSLHEALSGRSGSRPSSQSHHWWQIQSSNQGVNLFLCSNNLISGLFGAGIELFNAVLTLLIGGLTAENEQFLKRVNPRDAYLMILQ